MIISKIPRKRLLPQDADQPSGVVAKVRRNRGNQEPALKVLSGIAAKFLLPDSCPNFITIEESGFAALSPTTALHACVNINQGVGNMTTVRC